METDKNPIHDKKCFINIDRIEISSNYQFRQPISFDFDEFFVSNKTICKSLIVFCSIFIKFIDFANSKKFNHLFVVRGQILALQRL